MDNRKPKLIMSAWPLLVGAEDAAKLLGVSKSDFCAFHKSGQLGPEPIRLGRRNLWRVYALERWVESCCPPRWKWKKMQTFPPQVVKDSEGV